MRYEYKCNKCGTSYEYDLSIENRDWYNGRKCMECHGEIHRAVGNGGGFRLKGGGWESDGYSGLWGNSDDFKKQFGKGD